MRLRSLRKPSFQGWEKAGPEWVRFFGEGRVEADIMRAIYQCGPQDIAHKPVNMRLDELNKGKRHLVN